MAGGSYHNTFHKRFATLPKGLLLHSKRGPFAFQKDSFCIPKGVLLQPKRTPFEKRKGNTTNTHYYIYAIKHHIYASKHYIYTKQRKPPRSIKLLGGFRYIFVFQYLLGVSYRTCFAYYGDLYLTWISHFGLNLVGNLA